MGKKRMIDTRFWSDSFIVDKLNALDRLLFLYLLTNDKTNIIGIYELPMRTAAFETGIDKDNLDKMLERLSPKVEYFDGWIYIRNFPDYQAYNPKIELGIIAAWKGLPDKIKKCIDNFGIESERLSKAIYSLSKASKQIKYKSKDISDTTDNTNVLSYVSSPQSKSKKSEKTHKPTVEDTIIDFYNNTFKTKILPLDERKRKLKLRLKTYGPRDICTAILKAKTDPWFTGDNDSGWTGSLDYLIRNDSNIDKYMNYKPARSKKRYE